MKTLYKALLCLILPLSALAQVPVITSFQGPPVVCGTPSPAKTFSISATNNPTGYMWSVVPATGVIIYNPNSAQSQIGFPNVPGTYTLYANAVNGSGTSSTASFVVNVFETPSVSFSGMTQVCQGSPTFLSASATMMSGSSTLSYSWTPSTGLSSTNTRTVIATPPVTTNYTLLLTTPACSNEAHITVTVNPLPVIIPTSSRMSICVGESAILTINGGSDPYYINSVYTPSVSSISPTTTTAYTITATSPQGCSNKVVFTQNVSACVGIQAESTNRPLGIYPNPSSGYFNVSSPVTETAVIIDQLGQVVQKVSLMADTPTTVSGLSDGVYFLVTSSARIKLVVYH